MSTHASDRQRDASIPERIAVWWHNTREHWARLHELRAMPPGELERISADIGVTPAELVAKTDATDAAHRLMTTRMRTLGLTEDDARDVSLRLLADLRRTCARCSDKAKCAHDLARDPEGADWRTYCPNAADLDALTRAKAG
jgi:hypothetical protein